MQGIGIVGRKRVGKDTAARVLRDEFGYGRVGFADQVKTLALVLDPYVWQEGSALVWRLADLVKLIGWERAKDEFPEVRAFLQRQGDGTRQVLGDAVWLDAWELLVRRHRGPVVVPDVRYLNEAERLRRHRFPVLRVVRPGLPDDGDMHVSETQQDGIRVDITVHNEGTVDEFRQTVREALDWLGVEPAEAAA